MRASEFNDAPSDSKFHTFLKKKKHSSLSLNKAEKGWGKDRVIMLARSWYYVSKLCPQTPRTLNGA